MRRIKVFLSNPRMKLRESIRNTEIYNALRGTANNIGHPIESDQACKEEEEKNIK